MATEAPMTLQEMVSRVIDDAMQTDESRARLEYLLKPVNAARARQGLPNVDVNKPSL